jgi:hypothetical protein
VTTPAVVMRPIMLPSSSVNHSARSGPAATQAHAVTWQGCSVLIGAGESLEEGWAQC